MFTFCKWEVRSKNWFNWDQTIVATMLLSEMHLVLYHVRKKYGSYWVWSLKAMTARFHLCKHCFFPSQLASSPWEEPLHPEDILSLNISPPSFSINRWSSPYLFEVAKWWLFLFCNSFYIYYKLAFLEDQGRFSIPLLKDTSFLFNLLKLSE